MYSDELLCRKLSDMVSYTPESGIDWRFYEARMIWAKTMLRAIDDLDFPYRDSRNSAKWFMSNVFDIGSFLWICEALGLSAERIRKMFAAKIYIPFGGVYCGTTRIFNQGSCKSKEITARG